MGYDTRTNRDCSRSASGHMDSFRLLKYLWRRFALSTLTYIFTHHINSILFIPVTTVTSTMVVFCRFINIRLVQDKLWCQPPEFLKKLHVTGLSDGNSPVTGEFPAKKPVTQKMVSFDVVIMIEKKIIVTGVHSIAIVTHYHNPQYYEAYNSTANPVPNELCNKSV